MKAVLPYDASPSVRAIIAAAGGAIVRIVPLREADASGLRREIRDADVLLHVLAPVTAEIMKASPSLRLVQKVGVGVDAIDLDFAKSRGIAVCNMPGTNTAAVAELALALMLACLRRLVPLSGDTRAGLGWPPRPEYLDGAGEIGGRCVGLLGYGAVPRKLAPVLRALGAEVIAHDRSARSADVELVSLDSLLERSDILSLHVPLTPDTRGLLDAGRIASMKQGAIVINTARGALIDEAALAQALRDGRLAAAGLDVLGQEPPAPQHPLLALPNVVCTPHVAWLTDDTWRRSMAVIVENCRRLSAGEPLLHRIV
jgi:phosphoglycerate dehydrogenase-like enzyme